MRRRKIGDKTREAPATRLTIFLAGAPKFCLVVLALSLRISIGKAVANYSQYKSKLLADAKTKILVLFDRIHDKGKRNADRANHTTNERRYYHYLTNVMAEKFAGFIQSTEANGKIGTKD